MTLKARLGIAAVLLGTLGLSAAARPTGDWKAEHDAGWNAYQENRLEEAEKELRAAEKDARAFGPNDPRLATTLDHLAWVLAAEDKLDEAESMAKAGLAIREKTPDADLAASLNTLASVYDLEGRTAEARQLYARCVEIARKTSGPDDPSLADALDNLATADHLLGKLAEAEASYKEALAIREKVADARPADIAPTLHNLAALYIDQKKYPDAEALLKRALTIREASLGAEHPDVASTLEAIGWMYRLQGKAAEAEATLKKAMALFELDLGKDHPHVARCCSKLGRLNLDQGDHVEAEECCKRAVDVYERSGVDPAELATALEDYAVLLRKVGRNADAEKAETRARSLREPAKPAAAPKS
jgi:tetratricopeptide (TPR) repeat protein